MSTHFEIDAALSIDDVPTVRKLVERLQVSVVADDGDRSRIAVAAHELLENAVKFSTDGSAWMRVEIAEGTLTITTRNRASRADLADLSQIASELGAAPDSMSFYLGLMQKAPLEAGGLGLGRVAAEGDMRIALELDGDVVVVHATASLGGGC